MPEHQHPNRDPALEPSTFPDEEFTLLIESEDVERDAGPKDKDEADEVDELDDDVEEGFDDEDDEEE